MFKLLKKLIKWIIIIILIFMIVNFFHKKYINSKNNLEIKDVLPNEYHQQYPLANYVEESLDSVSLYTNFIIQSMLNFDQFENSYTMSEKFRTIINSILHKEYKYTKEVYNLQYIEEELLSLETVPNDTTHNYIFKVKNSMHKEIEGKIAIYGKENDVNLVISLQDNDQEIDINKARVLVDDSNAEVLAYLIVEQTQKIYETALEPDTACKYFYGSTIEKLAGDISYHAVVAYFLQAYNVDDNANVYEKVKEININKNDKENFYMSRKF
ncbi:MAG: hypothetical protein ACK5HR_01265 [Mycoplasmatales bacterium]